jgi:mono/diheme cytochrome c family protein
MRDNKLFKLAASLLAGALLLTMAAASDSINPKRGKVYFRANCRVCHDGTQSAVKLEPITKTMKQWESAFAEDGKVAHCLPLVKEKVGKDLTDQDLLDIQSYLVQHAADSDQPASCGN